MIAKRWGKSVRWTIATGRMLWPRSLQGLLCVEAQTRLERSGLWTWVEWAWPIGPRQQRVFSGHGWLSGGVVEEGRLAGSDWWGQSSSHPKSEEQTLCSDWAVGTKQFYLWSKNGGLAGPCLALLEINVRCPRVLSESCGNLLLCVRASRTYKRFLKLYLSAAIKLIDAPWKESFDKPK